MIKTILKKILFIEIIKKVIGIQRYEIFKHTIRYYCPFPMKYSLKNEIDFGSQEANNFFKEKLSKSRFYLEFGSGSSSILAQNMNKDFCSIEGDKNFYKFMCKKVDKNKISLKSLGIVKEYSIPVSLPFNYEETFLTKQKLKLKIIVR